jgi:hypothetical protein
LLIESLKPLTVKVNGRAIPMRPGHPVEFPEDQGGKLLAKARDKVRRLPSPGDTVALEGEPLTVLDVDTDPHGVTWALVADDRYDWRFVNATFLTKAGEVL